MYAKPAGNSAPTDAAPAEKAAVVAPETAVRSEPAPKSAPAASNSGMRVLKEDSNLK
jgi:hypothetical protein